MKKERLYKFFVMLLLFLSSMVFADEYDLENVLDEFVGTYIPVQYDNILNSSRSHYDAMLSNRDQYHDILLLNNNKCYSNANFHDGYAITRDEFNDFNFITNDKGKFIIDNNGNSYRKIGENIGTNGYLDFYSYVLDTIFKDVQAFNNISIEKNKVIIDEIEYSIILDSVFFETENVSVWLRGNGNLYALMIDGISAKLFESKDDEIMSFVSEKYIKEFPLFYWNESRYPKININNLSSENLRYLRNLIYAKHGYTFRSEDLRKLYESFFWYKRNPSFTEDDFANDEKRLLERIIKKENR